MTSTQAVGGLPSPRLQDPAGTPAPADTGRSGRPANLPSLTGLRWSAALLVFLYHVSVVQYFGGHASKIIYRAFDAGDVGVSFFFVLSGFVLTWSAPNARALPFYRRRFARVYPLHLATALIAIVLVYLSPPNTEPSGRQLLANLTLTQSWVPNVSYYQSVNTVSWSLSCEAFFYALFPLLFILLRRLSGRVNVLIVFACIAVDFLVPAFAHHLVPSSQVSFYLYYFPGARLPEFILGMSLALAVRSGSWRGPGVAVSLAATVTGYFMCDSMPLNYRYSACTIIGITCLIAAVALADIKNEPSPWRSRRAVRLGELSFAFYMIHIIVMRTGEIVFRSHPLEGWFYGSLAALSAFAVSLFAAWILYRVVEVPSRRLILRAARPSGARNAGIA